MFVSRGSGSPSDFFYLDFINGLVLKLNELRKDVFVVGDCGCVDNSCAERGAA